jgi:hypothetical protein
MKLPERSFHYLCCLFLAASGFPLASAGSRTTYRSTIYILPLSGNLQQLLAVEIERSGLPLIIMQNMREADYLITEHDGKAILIDNSAHTERAEIDLKPALPNRRRRRKQIVDTTSDAYKARWIVSNLKKVFRGPSWRDQIDGALFP